MLSLKSRTNPDWLAVVEQNLDEVLLDHAHCEKKAASTAMNLLFAYVQHETLVRDLADIVEEELAHFRLVLDLLAARGVPFRRLKPGSYGQQLGELVRKQEPGRGVDRLLVAGLIEARSCERFALLQQHLADSTLATFYRGLFESEARHHATYARLARLLDSEANVRQRWDELATHEARLFDQTIPQPRMHG